MVECQGGQATVRLLFNGVSQTVRRFVESAIEALLLVSEDGIEPPTRGFSILAKGPSLTPPNPQISASIVVM